MEPILNTLYVMTQGAYLRLDHDNVKVLIEKEVKIQVPLMHLSGVTIFGDVMISPSLIHRCAGEGRAVVFLSYSGRFRARVHGPVSGNVLLRKAQHEALANGDITANICKSIVAGKLQNSRNVTLRAAREEKSDDTAQGLKVAAKELAALITSLENAADIHEIRGIEGLAAKEYFSVFGSMIKADHDGFAFTTRSRRPPRDKVNALLSFIYTLLMGDCVSALEGVGLDPQIGYLHALRPGRYALALDLMEEFRSILADRLAISLINLRQINPDDFEDRPGGAVYLSEEGRKKVVMAYQKRKQDETQNPFIGRRAPLGLMPHLQARLLARRLRGDMDEYIPFIPK